MALIGKIRNNMWLVIVLLAVALGGFILMDMTSASNRGGFGSRTTIGEIEGQEIDYMDFQRAETALYGGSGDQYSKKSSLWNYYIENAIISNITDDNGIDVSGEELTELEFGANLSPVVQSFYRNPQTGQVDRNQLNEIKTAIDEGKVSNPEFAASFNELRKQVIKSQKQTKLVNLVAKSLYTPTWQAETLDKINNESATLEYVRIPFETIADSEITLTDEDFATYIKENEVKYTNKDEVRNLSYVVFDVKATTEDSMKIKEQMSVLASQFAESTNDSLFAINNNGFYGTNYVKADDLTGPLKDTVKSLSVGAVYGPYIDNSAYVVAKLVGKKVIADSAKASHILRTVTNGDPMQLVAAQAYIDSIKTLINSGSVTFADAATANSQDPGSASKGGDLGAFAPGAMVPEFNDAVFNGKVGSLYTVTTQFGVHLIKVNNLIYKTNELKYNVAYLAQAIIPSEGTQNAILDKVVSSLEGTKKIEDLTKLLVDSMKVETVGGLKQNDFVVGNLGLGQTSRDIVKWAFDEDTKVGDVSRDVHIYTDAANYVDSKYVVVALKSVDKPGVASVESVKETIEPLIKNKKKGEKIKAKISGTDINAIAASFSLTPGLAENVTFGRGSFPDGGQEPLVIGKSFALAAGAVTEPIVGSNGVYVVKVATKTPANPEAGGFMQKMQQTQAARGQVSFRLMEAMKKTAKIDDNRASFF